VPFRPHLVSFFVLFFGLRVVSLSGWAREMFSVCHLCLAFFWFVCVHFIFFFFFIFSFGVRKRCDLLKPNFNSQRFGVVLMKPVTPVRVLLPSLIALWFQDILLKLFTVPFSSLFSLSVLDHWTSLLERLNVSSKAGFK